MNFMGNSYMDWQEKGKGFFSRPAFPGRAYARKGGEGDTFYLPLSTWRPWRDEFLLTQWSQRALRGYFLSAFEYVAAVA
jgi:spore maturation protein CgeB